jgi:hypothetical protein
MREEMAGFIDSWMEDSGRDEGSRGTLSYILSIQLGAATISISTIEAPRNDPDAVAHIFSLSHACAEPTDVPNVSSPMDGSLTSLVFSSEARRLCAHTHTHTHMYSHTNTYDNV